jgi:3-hydroxyisobutyrate dehydrogenase
VPEQTPQTVAVLGLGHMGGPMAANLAAAGHAVRGFDPSADALTRAAAAGVVPAGSVAEAVRGADAVVTMLPNGELLLQAYDGDAGVVAAAQAAGAVLVDCSTVAVDDARRAHDLAAAAGLGMIDAPVSGGVVGAEAGTLTFMVGGAAEDLDRARPLLEVMGGRVVHCGDSGAGQAAKLCNNMLLAISTIATSEAFALGERLGLSAQALYDVASASSGQCWSLNVNCPVPGPVPASPANRDYEPGFAVALMRKDLRLAREAVEATGTPCELGLRAAETYEQLAADGLADRDFSVVYREIAQRAGAAA